MIRRIIYKNRKKKKKRKRSTRSIMCWCPILKRLPTCLFIRFWQFNVVYQWQIFWIRLHNSVDLKSFKRRFTKLVLPNLSTLALLLLKVSPPHRIRDESSGFLRVITSAMTSARPGLQSRSQRRGVMPFVLFWNFSGSMSQKSLKLQGKIKTKSTSCSCFSTGLLKGYYWLIDLYTDLLTLCSWRFQSGCEPLRWQRAIRPHTGEPCLSSWGRPPRSETSCGDDPYRLDTVLKFSTEGILNTTQTDFFFFW